MPIAATAMGGVVDAVAVDKRAPIIEAFIGLGSNLNHPHQQLLRAIEALSQLPHTQLIAHSHFYQTSPVGPQNQPDFMNAVALLKTSLSALALLHSLQRIEQQHLRTREQRWGPRTLDLDLLFYGDSVIASDELTVPHPRMFERDFVLLPLQELLQSQPNF